MNKLDLILRLVKEDKITTEEAKVLMATEKEYVYPYWNQPYYVTYGYVSTTPAIPTGDTITFTTTSN